MEAMIITRKVAVALGHSIWQSVVKALSQGLALSTVLILPFLCLNGILLSFFLLKSLFFKPKFVENRYKTIAIDPGQNTSDFEFLNSEAHPSAHNNEAQNASQVQEEQNSSIANVRSMIQQLYSYDSMDPEYISPNNDLIRLNDKIGSGFVGVLYKLKIDRHEPYPSTASDRASKCVKLIHLKSLRQIMNEVNGVVVNLSEAANTTAMLKPNSKGSILLGKYLEHYRQFVDYARKLDLTTQHKTQSVKDAARNVPNVLFYDHVFVHDGKCLGPRSRPKKVLKSLIQVDKRQLPVSLLLIMPVAKKNLRSALLSEWSQFTLTTAVEWGHQIALGLHYLHHNVGMAHLNLKPENILLFDSSAPGKQNVLKSVPLHSRFIVKISDCACGLLLPTASKVLSQADEASIYALEPMTGDKFGDGVHYDVHCFGMILLLMLVGYESFRRSFFWSQFPTGLVSVSRYRLVEIIHAYDRSRIPQNFADLLQQIFIGHITVAKILTHEAFESQENAKL